MGLGTDDQLLYIGAMSDAPLPELPLASLLMAKLAFEEELGLTEVPAAWLDRISNVEGPRPKPPTPATARIVSGPSPVEPAPSGEKVAAGGAAPAVPAPTGKSHRLATLAHQLKKCRGCALCNDRRRIVFSDGTASARLAFVGPGPSVTDEKMGLPFTDEAGFLLNKIIAAIKLRRDQVYLCHATKCVSKVSDGPSDDQIGACRDHLRAQLEAVGPDIVVTCGARATRAVLGDGISFEEVCGTVQPWGPVLVMPTYHPARLVADGSLKRPVWNHMKKVRQLLDGDSAKG